MTPAPLRKDMDVFAEIYNAAWARNWGFVPYDKADLDAYAQELQLVFDQHWFMVAEKIDTGEPVGMAITVPDINQVLAEDERPAAAVRLVALPAPPAGSSTAAASASSASSPSTSTPASRRALHRALRHGRGRARSGGGEMGWILETNIPMNRGMEAMGGRVVKRYRMYERRLEHDAAPAYPGRREGLGADPRDRAARVVAGR